MLLQSHEGFIDLLPALPAAWNTGFFSGIRTRGALSVSLQWKDGIPDRVVVRSEGGKTCRLRKAGVAAWRVTGPGGVKVPSTFEKETGVLEFKPVPGQAYEAMPLGVKR